MRWSDEQAPRCPDCRAIYASRTPPEEPPCQSCRVDLWEVNRDAGMIYMQARGQVIAGMGGAIDLNFTAVMDLMDLYGVVRRKECWERVHRCFHVFLKEQREKQKLEQMRPHGRRH